MLPIAIHNGVGGVNFNEWVKVLYGLVLSLALGFFMGWVICKVITIICAAMDRRRTNGFFTVAQIFGAAFMSFMQRCAGRTEIYRSSVSGRCIL